MKNRTSRRMASLPSAGLAGLLGLGLLLVAAMAVGEPPGGGRDHRRMAALVEELGLDAATREAVGAVLDEAHAQHRALRPQLREAHQRMRELMEAADPDETAIFAQVDRISDLEREATKSRIRTLLRVQELLPPDARTELLERMKRDHGRHGPRGDRHTRGPGGPEHGEGHRWHREDR